MAVIRVRTVEAKHEPKDTRICGSNDTVTNLIRRYQGASPPFKGSTELAHGSDVGRSTHHVETKVLCTDGHTLIQLAEPLNETNYLKGN